MTVKESNCPPKTDLVDYLLGKLPVEILDRVEAHFADCQSCEETIRNLNAQDTLSEIVGQAIECGDVSRPSDQQFLSSLIDRLQVPQPWNSNQRAELCDRGAEVLAAVQPTDDENVIGQLGNYLLEEIVGTGSTGVVFRAVDQQLNRTVALKVLRPSLGNQARIRFMAEAQAAASIEHPNVVTIYHVSEENGLALIAMQWIPGETLEERLTKVTFLPEDDVRQIATQIAAGLQAAHDNALIHRDIKPANIWLREETDEVTILDFGLARIADDDPHMTNTGMLAGTPNYMSPEQSRGQELDGRSDLFSLGCIMYRAATGKLPFGAGGVLATLQSIQNHHPAPPHQLNPGVSQDFADLTMCLLEKEVANRPDSAQHLKQALQESRDDWSFVAASQTANNRANKPTVSANSTSAGARKWIGWKWLSVAAMVALGFFGWQAFGQQIIRVATNHGELVIETNDENVEVKVLSNGEVVQILDADSLQRVDVRAGEYELHASSKSDESSEQTFEVKPNKIVMARGGKQIATITKISEPIADVTPNAGPQRPSVTIERIAPSEIQVNQPADFQLVVRNVGDTTARNVNVFDQIPADVEFVKSVPPARRFSNGKLNWELESLEPGQEKRIRLQLRPTRKGEIASVAQVTFTEGVGAITMTQPAETTTPITKNESPVEVVYKGKNAREWLHQLRTERSGQGVGDALSAFSTLFSELDDEIQELALPILAKQVRRLGGVENPRAKVGHPYFPRLFNQIFRQYEPQQVVDFAKGELKAGTAASQNQVTNFFSQDFFTSQDKKAKHISVLWESYPTIIDHCIDSLEDNADRNEFIRLNHVFAYTLGSLVGAENRSCNDPRQKLAGHDHPGLFEYLFEKLNSAKQPRTQSMLARKIFQFSNSDADYQRLANLMVEADTGTELAQELFIHFLGQSRKPSRAQRLAHLVIEPLIKIYESEELCAKLTDLMIGRRRAGMSAVSGSSSGIGGMGGGLGGGGRGSRGDHDENSSDSKKPKQELNDREQVQAFILEEIALFGAYGKTALPWLEKLVTAKPQDKSSGIPSINPTLRQMATEAIKSINEDIAAANEEGQAKPDSRNSRGSYGIGGGFGGDEPG